MNLSPVNHPVEWTFLSHPPCRDSVNQLVVGHENPLLFDGVLEEHLIYRVAWKHVHSTYNIPASTDQSFDQRAINIDVCKERKATSHYRFGFQFTGFAM